MFMEFAIFSGSKKAQQNLEYIVGFMIVLIFLVIMYVGFIAKYNYYGSKIIEKQRILKTNMILFRFYDYIVYDNGTINRTAFNKFNCGLFNYYDLSSVDCYKNVSAFLNVKLPSLLYMEGRIYYILIPGYTDAVTGYKKGSVVINGTMYDFVLKSDAYGGNYELLNISGVEKGESEDINIGGVNYTVEDIDYLGRYALISRLNFVSGVSRSDDVVASHGVVYGNMDDGIEMIDIYYWS